MFHWNMHAYGLSLGNYQMMMTWLPLFFLWSLIWKGLVLWLTARRGQAVWFALFLVVNTAGIAEIIYLLATGGFEELGKAKE